MERLVNVRFVFIMIAAIFIYSLALQVRPAIVFAEGGVTEFTPETAESGAVSVIQPGSKEHIEGGLKFWHIALIGLIVIGVAAAAGGGGGGGGGGGDSGD